MVKSITMDDLYEKSKNLGQDELILDVRSPEEYADGHVPGSRNISHDMVRQHVGELKKYKRLYIYCHSGGRVSFTAHELSQLGITNFDVVVSGGMPDWESSGYPVER